MAKYTEFLHLILPDLMDKYDVTLVNQNTTAIANELKRLNDNAGLTDKELETFAEYFAQLFKKIPTKDGAPVTEVYVNLFDPARIDPNAGLPVIVITGLEPGQQYSLNFKPVRVYDGTHDYDVVDELFVYNAELGYYQIPPEALESEVLNLYLDPDVDYSLCMFVKGATLPNQYKAPGIPNYINDALLSSVYRELNQHTDEIDQVLRKIYTVANLPLTDVFQNDFNPANVKYDEGLPYIVISNLNPGGQYALNFMPVRVYDGLHDYDIANELIHYSEEDGYYRIHPRALETDTLTLHLDPNADHTLNMFVEGPTLPKRYKTTDSLDYINDRLLTSVFAELDALKNVEAIATTSSQTQLTYLIANKVHRLEIDNDVTFCLPTPTGFAQIIVQANVIKPVTINWGTDYYFGGTVPVVTTGRHTFTFECDGENWYVKTEFKERAGTVTKSVNVNVFGKYEGTNYWDNATYTFDVTNGVANNWGWLSNGEYKFMYYPETGQIKNPAQATAFALEKGKPIPKYIVIPNAIGFLNTGYSYYEAKDVVCYAANANSGIFRANTDADATIIIPEGVTSLLSYTFAQSHKDASKQKFVLPSTLESINNSVFAQTSAGSLYHDLDLPDALTEIAYSAFSNCRFINIAIPDKVQVINKETFAYCKLLETVEIGAGITQIGVRAFRDCAALKTIRFKGDIAPEIDATAFYNITIDPDNPLTVFYPDEGTGYDAEVFRGKFPEGTLFEF